MAAEVAVGSPNVAVVGLGRADVCVTSLADDAAVRAVVLGSQGILAEETGADLPFTSELRSLLGQASASGHGDEDFSSLVLQLRERADARRPTRSR